MATRTVSTAGGSWNTTAAWAEGAVPTNADDVVWPGVGARTLTVTAGSVCRSVDLTSMTGSDVLAGSGDITVGNNTVPPGNNAWRGPVGGGISHTGSVTFVGTGGNGSVVIQSNGMTFGGAVAVNNGAGPTVSLLDAFACAGAFTKAFGCIFDTAGNSMAVGTTFGATSGTFTCGASVITISGTTVTVTPTTLNANTSEFIMNSAGAVTFTGTGKSFFKVTRTGTAVKTDSIIVAGAFTLLSGGTCTFTGNSATNRLLVQSSTLGTPVTITNASATVTGSNVDFQDISLGTSTNLSAITGKSGDCGGNTNITFTTPATQTSTGTASFTWSTHGWTSRVPLPQDDVSIPNAFVAGRTITADMPRLGRAITCTCTGSPTFNYFAVTVTAFGSTTWANGMTVTGASNAAFVWGGRGSYTITNNGATYSGSTSYSVQCVTGTYTVQDTLTTGTAVILDLTSGTLDLNGQTIANPGLTCTGSKTRTLIGGSATWSIGGTVAFAYWQVAGSNVTVSMGSSTIIWAAASTGTRIFTGLGGAGVTYGSLTYTVANSPGILSITGNNTWAGTWNIGSGRIVQCPSGGTQTFTAANGLGGVAGTNNGYEYLPNASGAYVTVPNSTALQFTSDFSLVFDGALDDWTPGTTMYLCGRVSGSTNTATSAYALSVFAATGVLRFSTIDGVTISSVNSSVAPAVVDGARLAVKVSWRASDGRVQFFTAGTAAGPFTQLGTNQTDTRVPQAAAIAFSIGSDSGGTALPLAGKVYRVQAINDATATTVLDADFTTKAFGLNAFTESSGNTGTLTERTVTINGALAQPGDGRVTLQAAATTTTLATGSGSTMTYTVPDHILATPSKAVYVLDGVDGGSNTGIVFCPPDSKAPSGPGDIDTARGPALVATASRIRASRY